METKKLDDSQLEHFNTELMTEKYWNVFLAEISKNIDINKPFKILDVGGGNGKFADRLLDLFPLLEITIIDNSEYLLSQNAKHPRKTLICGSATMLDKSGLNSKFNIITLNWVLHHLIGDSREKSLEIIANTINSLKEYLTQDGMISIIENLYPGMIWDSSPSKILYFLTSIKTPILSSIIRKLGLNTAGVGVCFLSEKIIKKIILNSNLTIISSSLMDTWAYNIFIRLAFLTQPMTMKNIWVK